MIFLTLRAFFYTLSGILYQSLQGIDKVDVNKKVPFEKFLKSSLFVLPTLRIVKFGIYTGSLILILIIFSTESQLDLVVYWSVMAFVVELPFLLYIVKMIKKKFELKLSIIYPLKYSIVSVGVFGLVYYLMENYLVYENKIFQFLPQVLLFVIFGVILYMGITYLIDKKTRYLFNAVISEIKNKDR